MIIFNLTDKNKLVRSTNLGLQFANNRKIRYIYKKYHNYNFHNNMQKFMRLLKKIIIRLFRYVFAF